MWGVLCLGELLVPAATHDEPATHAARQDYLIHTWRSADGLPQNSVTCLAQTPDGYLWVGTRSGGLARFDGIRFVVFTPQNTPALKDVEIEHLKVDSTGAMWIAAGNESVAVLENGQFRALRTRHAAPRWHPVELVAEYPDAVLLSTHGSALHRIERLGEVNQSTRLAVNPPPLNNPGDYWQDREKAIWYLAPDRSLARLELSGDRLVSTPFADLASPVRALAKGRNNEVWAATASRFGVLRGDGFEDRTPANPTAPSDIRGIAPTGDGGVWVLERERCRKALKGVWGAEASREAFPDPNANLRLLGDSKGGLWGIHYGEGLLHVRADGRSRFLTKKDGLPSALISCQMEDAEGNIWIGTRDGGLARIRRRAFKFFGVTEGIPGEVVQSVCEDVAGNLWVGTANGGLARLERDHFVQVPLPGLPGTTIESVTVFPDTTNGIWIGTINGGAMRYMNGEITIPFPSRIGRPQVTDVVLQDSLGRVWLGSGSGLLLWQDGTLTQFGSGQGFIDNVGVRALAEGPPGTIWIGTGPGELWQLDRDQLVRHRPPEEWPTARLSALLPDEKGVVWAGTLGGGLLRFQDGEFTRVTSEQGLPNDSIPQLLEDDQGNLWGGTYAGIFRATKADLARAAAGEVSRIACPVYDVLDGLPSQECSGWFQPACWRSKDGRFWFTTVKGLVTLDPGEVVINQHSPPVVIEDLRVDGRTRPLTGQQNPSIEPASHTSAAATRPSLKIEPGRHYVEFRFTGLNFTAPDKVRFRWKLEGVEREWREGGNQRMVGYGPLMPGDYCFRVLASNNDGVWNDEGTSLAFSVLPHFWETWLFKGVLIASSFALLACMLIATLRHRHRQQLERIERVHEVERERARIAQDLHDDLGTSLTQIGMLSGLVGHERTPPDEVRDLTRQIRSTARQMVSDLNEIVWAVNPKNDQLTELIGYLGNFAEVFFRNTSIRCRLKIPESLPDWPLIPEIRHNLFLAFKEAINNAARHSTADEVWVRARLEGEVLILTVEDNGEGFDQGSAAAPSGNGLANMHQRLTRMGGTCDIRSGVGGGTAVEFRLPVRT